MSPLLSIGVTITMLSSRFDKCTLPAKSCIVTATYNGIEGLISSENKSEGSLPYNALSKVTSNFNEFSICL